MTDTIAILPARAGNPTDARRNRDAAKAYCDAHGWGEIEVLEDNHGGDMCPAGDPSAGRLAPVFSRAHGGGHLLVGDLATISHKPDDLLRAVTSLIGAGVDLHSLEIGGRVIDHLPGLRIGLNIASDLQGRVDEADGQRRKEVHEAWDEAARFQREFASRLVKRWGVPQGGIPDLDAIHPMPDNPARREKVEKIERAQAILRKMLEDQAEQGDEESKAVLAEMDGKEQAVAKSEAQERGEAIRKARLERGWDLATLGAAAGISKSQVSRIEVEGKPGGAAECLAALGLDDAWPTPQSTAKSVETLDEAANA